MKHLANKFIVFDGCEGTGKSTQARLLHESLQDAGVAAILVRDPGTTRIGEQIRAILLNPEHQEIAMRTEMLLYMAARAQMMAQVILPALDRGQTVICDRFVSSTLAYQLGGDGITAEEIRAVAQIALKGRWPDLTLIFDMPIEQSMSRVKRAKDRIEQRPVAYHERVRRNFLAQAEADPRHFRVIDAARSVEEVEHHVTKILRRAMRQERLLLDVWKLNACCGDDEPFKDRVDRTKFAAATDDLVVPPFQLS